jgi:lipid II:glycine glycyltransferase (peptidoglycan interpeptide bridge formation enzyme)
MIIFFNKKNGKIYGTVMGRVHTEEELKTSVQPQGVLKSEIGKKVFDLKQTKRYEKLDFHILNKKVALNSKGEFVRFIDKLKEPETKPDSVETIVIDITKSLEEIKVDFSETTRRWIKKAEEEKMSFREIGFNERQLVYDVLEELEDLKDIRLAKNILQIRAPFLDGLRRMYVVEDFDKNPLAVALITCFRTKGFIYTLGGVTQKGRDTHAGDFLVWNLIKDAKDLGYKIFDLGGIYADWADDTKKKVNEFKTRWSGEKAPLDINKRKSLAK